MTKAIRWFYGLVWYAGEWGVREIYEEKGKYSWTDVLDMKGQTVEDVVNDFTNILDDIKSGNCFEIKNGELLKYTGKK